MTRARPALVVLALGNGLLGRLVLADTEAPELEPVPAAGKLQLGHDQLVADGALNRLVQHA
eukprot:8008951-Alexandrium_andersonii.AAC.1